MSDSQNLLVNVSCPFCKKALLVSISGFAGELASRVKQCRRCEREFHVHLLSQTSAIESPSDGEIRAAKDRIRYLKEERKRSLAEMLIRQEVCQKLYQDSLREAANLRARYESN